MSLYNDMRPRTLDEIMGQDKIVKVLKKDLSNKVPHAMLFTGTRGIGKTSIARIAARTLNCSNLTSDGNCCNECESCKQILSGNSFDVLELDAASHNSVEDIRELIGKVQYKAIGKYKVFIIDEVHMLSTAAFNCLLKTLEEPPANVLFILCTTETHKIPATIISRCRKYEFERISRSTIVDKLKKINQIYQLEAEEDALHVVAKMAKGSMRDAESIYEHFLGTKDCITATMVRELLGVTGEESVFQILQSVAEQNPCLATVVIKAAADKGASLSFLIEECFRVLMDIVSFRMSGDESELYDSSEYKENIIKFSYELTEEQCFSLMDALRDAYAQRNSNLEFAFEAAIINVIRCTTVIQTLQDRVDALEKQVTALTNGVYIPSSGPVSTEHQDPLDMHFEESKPALPNSEQPVPVSASNNTAPTDSSVSADEEDSFQPTDTSPFESTGSVAFDEFMSSLEDLPEEFDNVSVAETPSQPVAPAPTPTPNKSSVDIDNFLTGSSARQGDGGWGFGWNQEFGTS